MKEDGLISLSVEDNAWGCASNSPGSFRLTINSVVKRGVLSSLISLIKDLMNFPKCTFNNWESKRESSREEEASRGKRYLRSAGFWGEPGGSLIFPHPCSPFLPHPLLDCYLTLLGLPSLYRLSHPLKQSPNTQHFLFVPFGIVFWLPARAQTSDCLSANPVSATPLAVCP